MDATATLNLVPAADKPREDGVEVVWMMARMLKVAETVFKRESLVSSSFDH